MKTLASNNPDKAVELLNQAPQLSYAIFQALLLMGLVKPEALASVVEASAAAPSAGYPPAPTPALPQPTTYGAPGYNTPPIPGRSAYPPPPPPPPAVAPAAAEDPATQALIQQVLAMPQETVDQLAPDEREQIMTLRATYGR